MASSPQTPPPSLVAAPLWWGVLCPWGPQLATPDHFSRASLRGGPGVCGGGLCRWRLGHRALEGALASGCLQGKGSRVSLPLPAPSASQPRQEPRAGGWSLSVPGAPQWGEGSAGSHPSGNLVVPPAGRFSGTGPPAPVQSRQVMWTSRPTAVSVEEVVPSRGF